MTSALAALSWPRRTSRLTVRPATPDDVEPTWEFRRLPEVVEWITAAPDTLEDYTARFLAPARLEKTLVVELAGEVIADLYLSVQDAWAQSEVEEQAKRVQAEIGWSMHPAHSGHGYATEAVTELIRICFEELGLRRVLANCFADNVASWRMMERLGMRRELHTVQDSLHRSGRWLDGYMYALLADEWSTRTAAVRRTEPERVDRMSRHDWWGTVLDSPDPRALARFYSALLGWPISSESDTSCTLAPGDGVSYLACQLSPDYVRPVWPNVPGEQQMMLHLDIEVTDLAEAVERAVTSGARLADHQPQEDVRVLLDPDGHPFCLYTS